MGSSDVYQLILISSCNEFSLTWTLRSEFLLRPNLLDRPSDSSNKLRPREEIHCTFLILL